MIVDDFHTGRFRVQCTSLLDMGFILEINTTLFREKFIIRGIAQETNSSVVAAGNRLVLPLHAHDGHITETVVVRAQNMHTCLRMGGQIVQTYQKAGPIFSRPAPFNFADAWEKSCSDYENIHNPDRWVCVYYKGKEVYSFGERAAFLDVIEKCDTKNPGNYDQSVVVAEDTFKKMGKAVQIALESGIAAVLNLHDDLAKCGLIYRGVEKNSTFNFNATPKEDRKVSPFLCLSVCAAFLEGLQLAYKVGATNEKLRLAMIDKFSPEAVQSQAAIRRLADLNIEITSFENRLKTRFRPEKPEFSYMIADSERYWRKKYETGS